MMIPKNSRGLSVIEFLLAMFLGGALIFGMTKSFTNLLGYFQNVSVRQQLQGDADHTMTTILHELQHAQVTSVVICNCGGDNCSNWASCPASAAGAPPNSRIEFSPQGVPVTTAIYWMNRTVYMQNTGGEAQPLAKNVTGLMFTGNGQDLSQLWISLRLDAPTGRQTTATVLLANQAVRLMS